MGWYISGSFACLKTTLTLHWHNSKLGIILLRTLETLLHCFEFAALPLKNKTSFWSIFTQKSSHGKPDCYPWKVCLKVALGWHLRSWIWGGFPASPELRATHCACDVCTNSVVYTEYLFSFWESGCVPGRRWLHDQPPVKSRDSESLTSVPGRWHFTWVVTTHQGRN